jgi:hypothetical protein
VLINPKDGSRLLYRITGRAVRVEFGAGGAVTDRFQIPADVGEADVTFWILSRHHKLLSTEGYLQD